MVALLASPCGSCPVLTRLLLAAATSDGDVVVWEQQGASALPGTWPRDRVAIKIMRLHSEPITLLTTSGPHLVSGGRD